jgi:N-acetylneuraminate synthase
MSIFISAEIGINHNGDMNICKKLIDMASEAGCDAVKFQKRDIDLVYTNDYLSELRDSPWGKTQRDQKEGLEFSKDQYNEINDYCSKKNISWFASAWDLNSQKFLKDFDLKHNKIASAMIVYDDLLDLVSKEKKYTFISTGMATYDMIDNAVNIFKKNNCPYELMHTVSTYPMKPEDANLKLILKLKERYACNVGYSGHETGTAISIASCAMGATSLERHITLDKSMYGSDQSASLEAPALRYLVGAVRKIESALGNGEKVIIEAEKPVAEKLRQHIA